MSRRRTTVARIGRLTMLLLAPMVVATGQQRTNAMGPRAEVRLDGIVARRGTVQLGAGFNLASGPYLRWGVLGGVGATTHADRTVATWRADGVVRFVLDPLRESRRGVYGLAGLSLMDDGTRDIVAAGFGSLDANNDGRVDWVLENSYDRGSLDLNNNGTPDGDE